MDQGSLFFSVCAMMLCLLGATRCSKGDNCPCSDIPHLPLTKPPPETCQDTFRYSCVDSYVRKVGTSNLIKCKQDKGALYWTKASLNCIPDPLRRTTQPPQSKGTTNHTYILRGVHVTSTITPAPTSRQTTQSGSTSAPTQAPETSSAEWTSAAEHSPPSQVTFLTETEATSQTTSSSPTAEPSTYTTVDPQKQRHTHHTLGRTAGLITCISLVIVFAVFGCGYSWRSRNSFLMGTAEETMSMNDISSGLPS
ncbi:interleukin-15 receptor subunit alpha isoform X2 [Seriola lalandi dorsalis]|uniref:interleukin-15 receptor subunit alpha isoform X2 n=1 Tax=Seriola lalandi dorsalis TaxID=1841481 RepID=UPI000C6F650A|nr:interleukin-15 receptor subunit alpha isoform X2 [Seriola lalandi dorsalis]